MQGLIFLCICFQIRTLILEIETNEELTLILEIDAERGDAGG